MSILFSPTLTTVTVMISTKFRFRRESEKTASDFSHSYIIINVLINFLQSVHLTITEGGRSPEVT